MFQTRIITLRRAEVVEASWKISPLRIGERSRAGRERIGLHRLPIGIGQIRAGIHTHHLSAGSHRFNTELDCFPAQTRIRPDKFD